MLSFLGPVSWELAPDGTTMHLVGDRPKFPKNIKVDTRVQYAQDLSYHK